MYKKEFGNIQEAPTKNLLIARQWLKSWLFPFRYGRTINPKTGGQETLENTEDLIKMELLFKRIDEELLRRRKESEWKPTAQG